MSAVGEFDEGAGTSWEYEHRYTVLVTHPAVCQAVYRSASRAEVGMSAEAFLAVAAEMVPLVGETLPGSAEQGRRLGAWLGFRRKATREAQLGIPVGRAIARTLCSLALHGQGIRRVDQYVHGCSVTADIPSDVKTFGGVLAVTVTGTGNSTNVRAQAEIPGQLIDWGKSRQTLTAFLSDLELPLELPE